MSTWIYEVTLKGQKPGMIQNRFDVEAMVSMHKKSSKRSTTTVEPEEQAAACVYRCEDGEIGVPLEAIRLAVIEGGRDKKIGKRSVTTAGSSLVPGFLKFDDNPDIVPLFKDETLTERAPWKMRLDGANNNNTGQRVVAVRAGVPEWAVKLHVRIVDCDKPKEKMVQEMFSDAGTSIGIGANRLQKKGRFGGFKVVEFKRVGQED